MLDIHKIYGDMEANDVFLAYKGSITSELLSSVYAIVESRMESDKENIRRKKKFYQVVIECLQNMYLHMENRENESAAIFMIGRGRDSSLQIITGNFISNSKCEELGERIERINRQTPEELHDYHLEKLSSAQLSDKGGAGLGIIEIARKSGNKLQYRFDKLSEEYTFFTLAVKVN